MRLRRGSEGWGHCGFVRVFGVQGSADHPSQKHAKMLDYVTSSQVLPFMWRAHLPSACKRSGWYRVVCANVGRLGPFMEESQSCDPLLREMTHPRRPKQLLRQRLLLVWGLDATAQGLRQNAHGEAPPDKGAVLFWGPTNRL